MVGTPVNIATAAIKYYLPSTVESDGTIDTVDAATLGLVSGNSFILQLYVDNRPRQALLPGVSTPVRSSCAGVSPRWTWEKYASAEGRRLFRPASRPYLLFIPRGRARAGRTGAERWRRRGPG
jgi:hypothetical protein